MGDEQDVEALDAARAANGDPVIELDLIRKVGIHPPVALVGASFGCVKNAALLAFLAE